MEVIREKAEMRSWSRRMRRAGKSLALVPTMGYLHEGHLSLVREARAHAEVIVVSVYVNPGQFAPSEDLSTYPSDLQGDLLKLSQTGVVQAVFCPRNLYDYGIPGPLSAPPRQHLSAGSGKRRESFLFVFTFLHFWCDFFFQVAGE
jgi:pantoate--beta-alanine ligase